MTPRVWIAVGTIALVGAADGWAQSASDAPHLRSRRPSVSVAWLTTGAYPIGDAAGTLRRNVPGTTSPPPFTLFHASTDVNRAAGVEGRVAWPVSRSLAVEAGVAYSQPGLTVSITGDPEAPAATLDDSRVLQYVVDAALVWQLSRVSIGPRARPYLVAGGGYLRQLYDERTKVETGQIYHAGAGVRYWLRGGHGAGRDVGLRGELRYYVRRQGVEFAGRSRHYPGVSVSLFVGL